MVAASTTSVLDGKYLPVTPLQETRATRRLPSGMPSCPACNGPAVAVETATAHVDEATRIDLTFRCGRGETWMVTGLGLVDATEHARDALRQHAWTGATQASLGLMLELRGLVDDAYETYATALRCSDAFDRGFCCERRAAYEAAHGWLRTALQSMRDALSADERATGARAQTYRATIEALERELTAQGIAFPSAHRGKQDQRWLRECEIERPPGLGSRNELGEPLAEETIAIERLIRSERWDDAIGFTSRGAELARRTKRLDSAIAMQRFVVTAYMIWASWSTSGSEGTARTEEVERERARLRAWESERTP